MDSENRPEYKTVYSDLSDTERKKMLLDHYAECEPTLFGQLDGFNVGVGKGDSVMVPDDDGDCMFGGCTYELMHGADVRILIKKGTSKEDAIRLISKLLEWFQGDRDITNGVVKPSISRLFADIDGLDDLRGEYGDIEPDDIPF